VVKAGQASALSVSFKGNQISSDVTALQIAVWNAGKAPIVREEVLTPVEIVMEPSLPILEATLRKVSRGITQISLDESGLATGKLRLNWRILEQNDGCVVQLIYAGPSDAPVSVVGAVVGQPAVEKLPYSGSITSPTEQYAREARTSRIFAWSMIALGVLSSGLALWERLDPDLTSTPSPLRYFAVLMSIVCFGIGFYSVYTLPSNPPFGF
jgi:hypothetical protein